MSDTKVLEARRAFGVEGEGGTCDWDLVTDTDRVLLPGGGGVFSTTSLDTDRRRLGMTSWGVADIEVRDDRRND